MKTLLLIVLVYVLPAVTILIYCYRQATTLTVREYLKDSWMWLVPFINIAICLIIPVFELDNFSKRRSWGKKLRVKIEKIKNIKIK